VNIVLLKSGLPALKSVRKQGRKRLCRFCGRIVPKSAYSQLMAQEERRLNGQTHQNYW